MKQTLKTYAWILVMTVAVVIMAAGLCMFASKPEKTAAAYSGITIKPVSEIAAPGFPSSTVYSKSANIKFNSDYYPFTLNYEESDPDDSYSYSVTVTNASDTFFVYSGRDGDSGYSRRIVYFECGSKKIYANEISNLGNNYCGTTTRPTITVTLDFVKDTVPLPETPTKEGYHFVGWYYDAAYTRPYDNAPIYADTNLYAKFEINTYTITFNTDGGNAVQTMTVNWNSTPTLPTPVKEGHSFLGWYLPDGTKYEGSAVKSNLELTAHWEVQTFTVTFYVDGEVYAVLTVEYGTSFAELVAMANAMSLRITTLGAVGNEASTAKVAGDITAESLKLTGTDKVINTVKNNKWYILGGMLGGVILIGAVVAVVGVVKKKKRAATVVATVTNTAAAKPVKAVKKPTRRGGK